MDLTLFSLNYFRVWKNREVKTEDAIQEWVICGQKQKEERKQEASRESNGE